MKVKKMFFAWQEEKERIFLEEKAKEGYLLVKASVGSYEFKKTEPMDIAYQFDFKGIDFTNNDEYLQFFEDDGWVYINSVGGWYYFYKKKKNVEEKLSLYNDNKSIMNKYFKLLMFLGITGFSLYYMTLFFFPMLLTQFEDISEFMNGFMIGMYIVMCLITILHFLAVIRIFKKYLSLKSKITE